MTHAYYTCVTAPGSSPTQHQSATHSWNQPCQVWQPRAPRNVRLLTPGASTNAPYPASKFTQQNHLDIVLNLI